MHRTISEFQLVLPNFFLWTLVEVFASEVSPLDLVEFVLKGVENYSLHVIGGPCGYVLVVPKELDKWRTDSKRISSPTTYFLFYVFFTILCS